MLINSITELFPQDLNSCKKLLTIFAHPDDESINVGGILYQSQDENIETFICCLSKGENGVFDEKYSKNIIQIRVNELSKAAKILGVKKVFQKNIPDGKFLDNDLIIRGNIIQVIEEVSPQVIITHDPSGISNHPDHITTSEVVFKLIRDKYRDEINLYFATLKDNEISFRKNLKKDLNLKNLSMVTHEIDIINSVSKKAELYQVFESQNIAKRFNIPLKVWFEFNHYEALHRVDFKHKHKFEYFPFKMNNFI